MADVLECEGAPRDLGLQQGAACAEALRHRFAREPAWRRAGWWLGLGRPAALSRDLWRHFPHQAEMLAGLATGARVPAAWLERELGSELRADASPGLAAGTTRSSPAAAHAGGRPLLGRSLEGPTLVRRSRPEGLFATLEVARPWVCAALAGVNEEGLAALALTAAGAPEDDVAPGALLVQDCLERFARVEAALEWCSGRPGGGRATILLADAAGELAGVEIAGADHRVLRPEQGVIVAGPGERGRDLAKWLRDVEAPGADALTERLGPGSLALDPVGRRLRLGGEWLSP